MVFVVNIYSLSKQSYPENKYKIAKFMVRSIFYYKPLKFLESNLNQQTRVELEKKHPEFFTKCMRPYMDLTLPRTKAMKMVVEHHDWIIKKSLNDVYSNGVNLGGVTIGEDTYHFVLSYESRYWKEGELTLRLTDLKENYYVISFTIFEGKAYVGGVQGPEKDSGFSKKMTKELYGLRPKSLILEVLRTWLKKHDINAICGIRKKYHTYSSIRYRNISFDFDRYWSEHGGDHGQKHFFNVPLSQARKDLESLSRTKRKMYRKRYQFLDSLPEILN